MALLLFVAAGAPAMLILVAAIFGFRAAITVNIDSFGVQIICTIILLKFVKLTLRARVALPNGEIFFMERRLNHNKKPNKRREKYSPADILSLLKDGGIKLDHLDVSGCLGVKGDAASGVILAGGITCMMNILVTFLGFKSVQIAIRPSDGCINWLKLEGIAHIAPAQIIVAAAKKRRLQYYRKAAKQRCTQ